MVRHKITALVLLLLFTRCAAADDVPAYVAASVHVDGCSGTVVAVDGARAWIVTAAHCFEDGQAVAFVTGDKRKRGAGLVVMQDADADLSLVRVRAVDVTGVATVPPSRPPGEFVSIGYPRNKGPETVRLKFRGPERITNLPRDRWAFDVLRGKFRNGSSGSGVFVGGRLVAVATHGTDDVEMYAAPLSELRTFLRRAETEFRVAILAPRSRTTVPPFTPLAFAWPFSSGPASWGDKDRTREILELKKRIAELEKAKPGTGQPGPAGPAGPRGEPGPGLDPAALAAIEKRIVELENWRGRFRATLRVRVSPVSKRNN